MKREAFAVLAVLLSVGRPLAGASFGDELLGRPAPSLELTDWTNSEPLDLHDLRGKVVLLRWWTAPGCPFCAETAPALGELWERYAVKGLTIIGIYHHKASGPLSADDVKRYARDFGFRFPLAIDRDWRNLRRWWLDGNERGWTSVSFLLDSRGIVRWVHPGGAYPPGSSDYQELVARIEELLPDPTENR